MITADNEKSAAQPLISHLIELRNRLLRSLLCIVLVFLSIYYFSNQIFEFVADPLTRFMGNGEQMITTRPLDSFFVPFKLTFTVAFFISIPYLLHQAWAFVAPGLYQREIRVALPLLASSIVLFYVGMAFAYFLMLPVFFHFAVNAAPGNVSVMTDISYYLEFVLQMLFVFGFVFEIPVATVLLILAGIVSADKLVENRGYVVIACFTIGMLFTPNDVLSQTFVAVPMWILFEIGVYAGRLLRSGR